MIQTRGQRVRTRRSLMIPVLAVLVALVFSVVSAPATEAAPQVDALRVKAADLSQFQPGNIISDAVFYNSATMSEGQIQSFLNSKVSSCRAGYTCLKDKTDATRSISGDPMCNAYPGGGVESAARIILKVAQACGINPQVLIVMLQKEQGLVTDTWPTAGQYRAAMGQGCPDTAPCDAEYYGFFNQVYGAARQLKRYANPPGTSNFFTWYAPGRTWNVQYNPNSACGSAPVYIANKATAALYYYTPYQPNRAALAAGYGLGDSCSAYGNRNFFQYFTDWFGSTQGGGAVSAVPAPTLSSLNGSPHILAVDAGGTLWGYPVRATAVWGAPVALSTGLGAVSAVVPMGDLSGDGRRDVIVATRAGAAIRLIGTGAPTYAAPVVLPVDWSGAVLVTAAGDFDGDGLGDVFTTDAAGSLRLWPGTPEGGLGTARTIGWGWSTMNVLSGGVDLTSDGVPDLLARKTDGTLHLYAGNGRGGFGTSRQFGIGWQAMSKLLSPGDLSGDGIADVLAVDSSGRLLLYVGVAGGGLTGGQAVGNGWGGMAALAGPGRAAGAARSPHPGVGDLSGDGAADVAGLSSAGDLILYRGDRASSWRESTTISRGWPKGSRVIPMGDFDGDTLRDIARVAPDGTLTLFRGTGGGALAAGRVIGWGWNGFAEVVGGIDFDGDGSTDVIARATDGALLLYRGDGSGGWTADSGGRIGNGWSSMTRMTAAGDFDGDGHGDLVAQSADGALWLYPTDGAGSWGAARRLGQGWSAMTALFSPGDFSGDGRMDLIARSSSGQLILYRGDGQGGFSGSSVVGWGWGAFVSVG